MVRLTFVYLFIALLSPSVFDSGFFHSNGISTVFASSDNKMERLNTIPLIIAHRGDMELMPKNTIPAFELALSKNVDFVEPDLVLTKDHFLVCQHDLTLASRTDVRSRPEFAHLRITERKVTYDNVAETIKDDWIVSDFTLEELKQLQIVHWNQTLAVSIPTFDEFLDTVKNFGNTHEQNRVAGIMPELKHPSYFNALANTSHFMEKMFLQKLEEHGFLMKMEDNKLNSTLTPLVVQCWEQETIDFLHEHTPHLRLLRVLWFNNPEYLTFGGMAKLAGKIEFVGLYKEYLVTGENTEIGDEKLTFGPEETERLGGFIPAERVVDYLEELGIKVALYTMYNSTTKAEFEYFFGRRVHAFFVEGLLNGMKIRDEYFIGGNKAEASSPV